MMEQRCCDLEYLQLRNLPTSNLMRYHSIHMHHLHTHFGLTDAVLQWFSSYLTDGTHYVSLSNHCSAFAPVHSGVHQGSVIGSVFHHCILGHCLPSLSHTLSCTINLIMTYNDRCLRPLTKYPSYFALCSHA